MRSKESSSSGVTTVITTTDLNTLAYPNILLSSDESSVAGSDVDEDCQFVMCKLLDWVDSHLTTMTTMIGGLGPAAAIEAATSGSGGADVQELEEEQEVQEVEMSPGEDVYDPSTALATTSLDDSVSDLLKLTAATMYYSNQQKILNNTPGYTVLVENAYLQHLLAINKNENVFRVKQIHDYYGGCFVCGQKVEFNMKHYQVSLYLKNSSFISFHFQSKVSYIRLLCKSIFFLML